MIINLCFSNLHDSPYVSCFFIFSNFLSFDSSSFFMFFILSNKRSRHRLCSVKNILILRNFAKFTGNYLCQSLFFNKVAGLRPAALLKKKLWHSCFPVNFVKYLRTHFLENTSGTIASIATHLKFTCS